MLQPKPFLDKFKIRNTAFGVERRRNMAKLILEHGTEFPMPLTYEDIDIAVQEWLENLEIEYEGVKLPTYKLYSNQRINEYSQSWSNLDESGNLVTNFKTITRDNNPKQGKINGNSFNIPGNRKYPMFIRPTLQENGTIAYDMYSMTQPMAVDFSFTVGIVCVKYELINKFNQLLLNQFKALECYIFPNNHSIMMKLDEVSDDSHYDINDRKYYSQTFKITVNAYIIADSDYEVTRLPSRLVLRMTEGRTVDSNDKFALETVQTATTRMAIPEVNQMGEECLPFDMEASGKKHDYGDYISIEEDYVAPEKCIREEDNYYNKIINIIANFDCKECHSFIVDTDIVIQEVELTNIFDFVVTINKEKVDFENDVKFQKGDEIGICATKDEVDNPAEIILVGYDPNVVFDINKIPESSLDEVPDEEIIDIE